MPENEDKPLMDGSLLAFDESESRTDSADDDDDADVPRMTEPPDDEKAEDAVEFLDGLLAHMDLDTDITIRENLEEVELDIGGPDAGRAIGRKGQTLDALQFLVNKVVNRRPQGRRHVVLDSGDYRARHDKGLEDLAKRQAKKAVDQGRVVSLQPMSPRDRRVVHLSLAKFPGINTESDGQGAGRRIQIIPAGMTGGGGGGGRDGDGGGRRRRRS